MFNAIAGRAWLTLWILVGLPVLVMLWFPIWQMIAVRNPSLAAFRRPSLLLEAEATHPRRP